MYISKPAFSEPCVKYLPISMSAIAISSPPLMHRIKMVSVAFSFIIPTSVSSACPTSSLSSSSAPSSSQALWPWPFIHSAGHKAYGQLYRRSPLSNLQNPNWIADGLSFVCLFISSLKSTPNNARRGRGELISSIYQCPKVGTRWSEGKGWGVMGGRGWLVMTLPQFPVYAHEARLDSIQKISARGVFFRSVSHFTPICHRLFHLISCA